MEEVGISVIICCYNSSKRIEETLKALSKQVNLEHIKYEM